MSNRQIEIERQRGVTEDGRIQSVRQIDRNRQRELIESKIHRMRERPNREKLIE